MRYGLRTSHQLGVITMQEKLLAKNLLDFSKTLARPLFEKAAFPWEVFDKLSEFIFEKTQRSPMILPIIMEI